MVISPQAIASVEEWRSSTVYAALSLDEQVGDPSGMTWSLAKRKQR